LNSSRRSRGARDVDLVDQHRAREPFLVNTRPQRQAVLTNQLPANCAGNFQSQLSRKGAGIHARKALPDGRVTGPNRSSCSLTVMCRTPLQRRLILPARYRSRIDRKKING
jgi:hypothetical protein